MAHLTTTLIDEIIRTKGKCGMTQHEMVQLAWLVKRAYEDSNNVPSPKYVSRSDVLEECAKICDDLDDLGEWGEAAAACARAIRSRISGGSK